jgi:hypothetical protein
MIGLFVRARFSISEPIVRLARDSAEKECAEVRRVCDTVLAEWRRLDPEIVPVMTSNIS